MARQIKLDSAGIRAVLLSGQVAAEIGALASGIAARVEGETARNGEPIPVVVDEGKSDRARAVVGMLHPAALGLEAKHGVLTKAARAEGLQVKSARGAK